MSTNRKARAWVEIRADALRSNYARVAGAAEGSAVLPMVKADAYGLGVGAVVGCLEAMDPWGFGVAAVQEGVALRRSGVQRRIVVCSPAPPGEEAAAVEHDLELSVSSVDAVERLAAAAAKSGRVAVYHIDVDTGMGRSGFDWRRGAEWLPAVAAVSATEAAGGSKIRCAGIYTHLHSADEDESTVEEQLSRLDEVLAIAARDEMSARSPTDEAPRPGPLLNDDSVVHIFNSAGTFRRHGRATAVVRPGIFLYGGGIGAGQPSPDPVVSVRARVAHVRAVSARNDARLWRHLHVERRRAVGDAFDRIRRWVSPVAEQPGQCDHPRGPGTDHRTDLHGRDGGRHQRRFGGPRG